MRHRKLPVMTIRNVRDLSLLLQNDPLLPHTDEEVEKVLKNKPNKATKGKVLIFPRNIKNGDRMTTAYWSETTNNWIKSFKLFTIAGEKQEVDPYSIIPTKVL